MAKKDSKLSPMMAQYFEVKSKYPDTILFFRVGDFYEMFFDDAKTASSELDLVLTGKDWAGGARTYVRCSVSQCR